MNVSSASNKYMALYLYAGPASATTKSTSPAAASTSSNAVPADRQADKAQISDAAKAASEKLLQEQGASETLKQKVDAVYADAKSRGTSITLDFSKPGEPLNLSSFTDDELGKIANDKDGQYPTDLSDYARGALNARVQVTLEPYEWSVQNGDRRGQAKAIDILYGQMRPDARSALGWTPVMMQSNDSMLDLDTHRYGKFDDNTVLANLLYASQHGGLSYNGSQTAAA